MQDKIRDGIGALRAAAAVLQHKWRSKPKGEQLRRRLADLERALDLVSLDALVELLLRMQVVSDSMALRDVIAAADAMYVAGQRIDIRIGNDGEIVVQSLSPEETAEIVALGPQHGSGDDCAICKVMERQRRDREARASAAGN
jgi:hypothetical protein